MYVWLWPLGTKFYPVLPKRNIIAIRVCSWSPGNKSKIQLLLMLVMMIWQRQKIKINFSVAAAVKPSSVASHSGHMVQEVKRGTNNTTVTEGLILYNWYLCHWRHKERNKNIRYLLTGLGHKVAVGWGTELQAGRSQVWFPMVSSEFFIDIVLLAALWPWVWLSLSTEMSTRNISWG